ncbi:GNAT family N-acetyltransferase [Clostridium cavendishii]|nr:GNAT family N-acetyltransferase [Clostridium cavendishii]
MLKYKKFEKKYLDSCIEIVKSTWLFEENLINPKNPKYIYKHYVMNCVNWSEHLDLIVDDNDQVVGILFGSIEDNAWIKEFKYTIIQYKLNISMWWHIIIGDLGQRKRAFEVYKNMKSHDAKGEADADNFDSEINLFILSPSLRGQGYGRKLMNRYVEFCKENNLDTVFLWTTTDCSWEFYERYGFNELRRFKFSSLDEENTIVYQLNVWEK